MEPPGTAVRNAILAGHARPSGPKLSVLFRSSYALSSSHMLIVSGASHDPRQRSRTRAPLPPQPGIYLHIRPTTVPPQHLHQHCSPYSHQPTSPPSLIPSAVLSNFQAGKLDYQAATASMLLDPDSALHAAGRPAVTANAVVAAIKPQPGGAGHRTSGCPPAPTCLTKVTGSRFTRASCAVGWLGGWWRA